MKSKKELEKQFKAHNESNEKLKEDFKMSPDIGDSIALTFAFPVDPLNKGEVKSVGGIVKRRGHNQVKLKGSKKTIKM